MKTDNLTFNKKYSETPKFLILPGSLYLTDFSLITENKWRELNKIRKYLGENYATFRIDNWFENGYFCRSAAYSKLPVLMIQFENHCEIIEFPDLKNLNLLIIGIKYNDPGISVKIGFSEFEYKAKKNLHLGLWEQTLKFNLNRNKVAVRKFNNIGGGPAYIDDFSTTSKK